MLACCSVLSKQHVAAVLSVYVCLSGRASQRKGCRYRCTEGAKEESVNKGGGGGVQNEGNAWQETDKDFRGKEKEGDTARPKRGRHWRREADIHTLFWMQLLWGYLPTVCDVWSQVFEHGFSCVVPPVWSALHVSTAGSCFLDVRWLRENAMIRRIDRRTDRKWKIRDDKVEQQLCTGAHGRSCLPAAVCSGDGSFWETSTQLHHMVITGHHKLRASHPTDSCTLCLLLLWLSEVEAGSCS